MPISLKRAATALAVVLALTTAAAAAPAKPSPEHRSAVLDLLAATHTLDFMQKLFPVLLAQQRGLIQKAYPNLPTKAIDLINSEFVAAFKESTPQWETAMVDIYARYFTVSEIKEMVAFYKSPTGAKAARLMPRLTAEGMSAGQRWAQQVVPEISKRILRKLKAAGYIKA